MLTSKNCVWHNASGHFRCWGGSLNPLVRALAIYTVLARGKGREDCYVTSVPCCGDAADQISVYSI